MGKTGLEVLGLYATATSAEMALDRLLSAGYTREAISLLMEDAYATREWVETNTQRRYGATTSSLVGGTLGSLDGIRSMSIRGMGPVISAGVLMQRLDTNSADSITKAITGMGIPEFEARHYESRVKDGDVLLAVHCETQAETQRVEGILNGPGCEEVAGWAETPVRWRSLKREPYLGAARPEMRLH